MKRMLIALALAVALAGTAGAEPLSFHLWEDVCVHHG